MKTRVLKMAVTRDHETTVQFPFSICNSMDLCHLLNVLQMVSK